MRSIPVGDFQIGADERNAITQVLDRGRLSEGVKTAEFEREFAAYIGTKHCVATSSGTAALLCLLTALIYDDRYPKFQRGAKIVTTPLTYVATVNAIVLAGLEPVFADVDRRTFGLLPGEVERVLMETDGVCAILPVHLMGYPCAMDELRLLADQYDLLLLEDAAQAHGSKYGGRRCGSLGTAGIFSFYIAHNIQAGEMGCVTTDDAHLAKMLKKIKANGRECDCIRCTRSGGYCPRLSDDGPWTGVMDGDPRFIHDVIGYNFKVMEFQPTLALTQLGKAEAIFSARQHNVRSLNGLLSEFNEMLVLPVFDWNVSYLAYPLVVKPGANTRGEIRQALHGYGVESRPLFGCIPLHQPAYSKYKEEYMGKLPNAEHLGENAFYIGCHQYLNSEDLYFIRAAISSYFRRPVGLR